MKITKYQDQEIKDTPHKTPVDVFYISNESDSLARILVVKAPRPVYPTRVL